MVYTVVKALREMVRAPSRAALVAALPLIQLVDLQATAYCQDDKGLGAQAMANRGYPDGVKSHLGLSLRHLGK